MSEINLFTRKSTLEKILVTGIIPADFQPESRTDIKTLRHLVQSFKENNQMQPITLLKIDVGKANSGYHIADGHRRVAAATILGWEYIEAIVYYSNTIDALPVMFATSNTQRKLSGLEAQEIFVRNSTALPVSTRNKIISAKNLIGDDLFYDIVKNKTLVATTLKSEISRVLSIVGSVDPRLAIKMEDNMFKLAKTFIKQGISAVQFIRLSKDLKPIQQVSKYKKLLSLKSL